MKGTWVRESVTFLVGTLQADTARPRGVLQAGAPSAQDGLRTPQPSAPWVFPGKLLKAATLGHPYVA